jgi:hypothetical protein
MNQITSTKLGLIAICFATVPLSLAQTPRIGTSGRNQTSATTPATAGHSGLSGNSTNAVQPGTNFRSSTITAPNTNAGAHTGINAGAQTRISNQIRGISGGAAAGLSGSIGTSTGAAQTGANARAGTSTTAGTPIPRQFIPAPTPFGRNFSTAGESPSPLPLASVTPTPTPTPAQVL